jgi:hypothetical protein
LIACHNILILFVDLTLGWVSVERVLLATMWGRISRVKAFENYVCVLRIH